MKNIRDHITCNIEIAIQKSAGVSFERLQKRIPIQILMTIHTKHDAILTTEIKTTI